VLTANYNAATDNHHSSQVPHPIPSSANDARLAALFWVVLALGVFLSAWYQINQIVDGDQLQMIQRGYQAAYLGHWPATGNAASVVGSVPGFLSTLVVAGPLMLWDSPYAPVILLLALRLIGFLLIDAVIRDIFPGALAMRVVVVLLLWLNPWVQYDSLLYNPAYLIFCAGLHLFTAWRMRANPHFVWTFLHVMSIALAMQLHFSWPLLAFISLYLWWRGLIRVQWWAVLSVALLALVSLVPYLLALFSNPEIAHNPDPKARERYIGWGAVHVYPVLKSVIYWLRYAAWAFPGKLVNDVGFDWLGQLQWLEVTAIWVWRMVQYGLAVITMVVAFAANAVALRTIRRCWRRRDGEVNSSSTWLLLYALGAFVAMLISAGLAPLVFNYWHLVLILPAAIMPLLVWLHQLAWRGVTFRFLVGVAAILMITNVVAIQDSRKFSWQVDYATQVNQYVEREIPASKPD